MKFLELNLETLNLSRGSIGFSLRHDSLELRLDSTVVVLFNISIRAYLGKKHSNFGQCYSYFYNSFKR